MKHESTFLLRVGTAIFVLSICLKTLEGTDDPSKDPKIISWVWPPNGAVLLPRPFQIRIEYAGLIDDRDYVLKIFMNSTLAVRSVFNFDSLEGIVTVASVPSVSTGSLLIEAEVWDAVGKHEEPLEGSFIELYISDTWPASAAVKRYSSVQCMGGVQQALEIFPSPRRVCMFSNVCWARGHLVYFSDPELDQHVPAHSSIWSLHGELLKVAANPAHA
jgi:hypothetical protein